MKYDPGDWMCGFGEVCVKPEHGNKTWFFTDFFCTDVQCTFVLQRHTNKLMSLNISTIGSRFGLPFLIFQVVVFLNLSKQCFFISDRIYMFTVLQITCLNAFAKKDGPICSFLCKMLYMHLFCVLSGLPKYCLCERFAILVTSSCTEKRENHWLTPRLLMKSKIDSFAIAGIVSTI